MSADASPASSDKSYVPSGPKRPKRKSRKLDEKSCHGLRQVIRKLDNGNFSSYEEVAQALAKEFVYGKEGSRKEKDERNMRRRAYDVMNVLNAVGSLRKRGKKLIYFGTERNLSRFEMKLKHDDQMEELCEMRAQNDVLQYQLMALDWLHSCENSPYADDVNPVPFDLFGASTEYDVLYGDNDEFTEVMFAFEGQFTLMSSLKALAIMHGTKLSPDETWLTLSRYGGRTVYYHKKTNRADRAAKNLGSFIDKNEDTESDEEPEEPQKSGEGSGEMTVIKCQSEEEVLEAFASTDVPKEIWQSLLGQNEGAQSEEVVITIY